MSFARQLVLGVVALVFLTLVTGRVAIVALRQTTSVQEAVARDFATDLMAVERLRFEAEHLVAATRGYLLRHDDLVGERFAKLIRQFEQLLEELHGRGLDAESQSYLGRIDTAAADYIATAKTLSTHQNELLEFLENTLSPKRELLQHYLAEFVRHQQNIFEDELRDARSSATHAQVTVMLTTGLALLLSGGSRRSCMRKLARMYAREQAAAAVAMREANARQELLAVVSHDLRNPLNTITLGASVLAESTPATAPGRRQVTAICERRRANDPPDRRAARRGAHRRRRRSSCIAARSPSAS